MDKPETPPELSYDLDELWRLAVVAGTHIYLNAKRHKNGLPVDAYQEPYKQYAQAISPQKMLMVLHRLRRAGELLDAVKGAVQDLPLRGRIDAYLSGVITQADFVEALPYYAADLQAEATEAKQAGAMQ